MNYIGQPAITFEGEVMEMSNSMIDYVFILLCIGIIVFYFIMAPKAMLKFIGFCCIAYCTIIVYLLSCGDWIVTQELMERGLKEVSYGETRCRRIL